MLEGELEQLIAEQALDMRRGHRVSRPNTRSLDAYNGRPIRKLSSFRKPISPLDHRHGTPAGYVAGCKLDCCKAAERKRVRERNERLRQLPHDSIPHGTQNGYSNYGCKCTSCTAANTKTHAEYIKRKRAA